MRKIFAALIVAAMIVFGHAQAELNDTSDQSDDEIFACRFFTVEHYVLPKTIRKKEDGFSVNVRYKIEKKSSVTVTYVFFNNGNINAPEDTVRFTVFGMSSPGGLDNIRYIKSEPTARKIYQICKNFL